MKIAYIGVYLYWQGSWDSVVSTVTMLRAGWTEQRAQIPAGATHFSLLHNAQTGCETQPTSHSMGTSVSFRWAVETVEWSGSVADQLPPSSAEVQHIFLSAICFHEVHRGKFTFYLVLAHQRLRFSAVQILIWLSRTRKSIKECPSELSDRN
jgi:hypothetical protein